MQIQLNLLSVSNYLAENPITFVSVLFIAVCLLPFVLCVLRGRFHHASSFIMLALSIAVLQGTGIDLEHHAPRTIELATDISNWDINLFVFSGDDALPLYYYYSTAIYVFALPFVYLGLSAASSLQVIATVFFLVMAFGMRRVFLVMTTPSRPEGTPDRELAGLITIVFLTSNYVYLNFVWRNAYPEAAVYALVPLVFLSLRRRHLALSTALVFLQVCIHPPVFPQAAVAAIVAHLATSGRPVLAEALRCLAITLAATVLASPAWFWALRNKDAINGVDALPVRFEDTFLELFAVFEVIGVTATGPYLLLLLGVTLWKYRAYSSSTGVLLAATLISLLIQLEYLTPFVTRIPLMDLGLFIWRWMFVSIWFGALVLCLGWCLSSESRLLKAVLICAGLQATILAGMHIRAPVPDARYADYFAPLAKNTVRWGFSEYYPAYAPTSGRCDSLRSEPVESITFAELSQEGILSDRTLALDAGPVGGLGYLAGNKRADVTGCGAILFISHPEPGTPIRFGIAPDFLMRHPEIKIFVPVFALVLVGAGALGARRRGVDHG